MTASSYSLTNGQQVQGADGRTYTINQNADGTYSLSFSANTESGPQTALAQVGLSQSELQGYLSGAFQGSAATTPEFGIGDPSFNGTNSLLTQADVSGNPQDAFGAGAGNEGGGSFGQPTAQQLGQGVPGWIDAFGEAGTAIVGGLLGGAALGPLIGATEAGAVSGAGVGAEEANVQGQNILTGAAEGGVGGGIGANIDIGGTLSDVGNYFGLTDLTGGAAAGAPTDLTTTTGGTGTPQITPQVGTSGGAAPVGATISPTDITSAEGAQIATQTGPSLDDTKVNALGQTGSAGGGTQLGGEAFASGGQSLPSPTGTLQSSPINPGGGDTNSIGPINSTATTAPTSLAPSGPTINPSGLDLSQTTLPAGGGNVSGAATPSSVQLPSGGGNVSGVGGASPPPSTPGFFDNIESGNFGAAGGNILSAVEKNPSLALGGAFTAYEAAQGPAPLTAAEKSLQAQGNTLNATGQSDLATAQSGTLTAPQSVTIAQYVQGQQNQLYQQLASAGVTNPSQDSRFIQGMQTIQQQAIAQAQTYIQQNFSNAMSEMGAGANDLTAVANAELQADNTYTESLTAALQAMGGLYNIGGLSKAVTQTGGGASGGAAIAPVGGGTGTQQIAAA